MKPYELPYSLPCERSVLGALLRDYRLIAQVSRTLRPEAFYAPEHRACYELLLDLEAQGRPTDLVSFGELVGRMPGRYGPLSEVHRWYDELPSTASVGWHAAQVIDLWRRRALLSALEAQVEALRSGQEVDDVAGQVTRAVEELK